MREWFGQAESQGAIVWRGQFVGHCHQRLAKGVAGPETPDARHRITREHRCAVVEHQSLAQPQRPDRTVVLDCVAFDHLRLGGQRSRPAHRAYRTPDRRGCAWPGRCEDGSSKLRSPSGNEPQRSFVFRPRYMGCERIAAAPAAPLSMSRRRMASPSNRLNSCDGPSGGKSRISRLGHPRRRCRAP